MLSGLNEPEQVVSTALILVMRNTAKSGHTLEAVPTFATSESAATVEALSTLTHVGTSM
jgi:hypothetical protein